jgi:hypothetical protein
MASTSGAATMVVDLDSPSKEKETEMNAKLPSQYEAFVIDVTPISFVTPTGSLLALTWKGGRHHPTRASSSSSEKLKILLFRPKIILRRQWNHFLPWLRRLFLGPILFRRLCSGSHSRAGRRSGDAQTSSLGKGEDAEEQGGMSSWWAKKGFLVDPCIALASILP